MAELRSFMLVLSILDLSTMSQSTDKISDSCPTIARFNLSGEIPDSSGLVKRSGHVFPPELRWLEDGVTFGCICYDKPCLPLCCPLEMIGVDGVCVTDDESTSLTFPSFPSADGGQVYAQNFHTLVSDPCGSNGSYILDPENHSEDVFHLMKNGSIYLPQGTVSKMYDLGSYCLWPTNQSSGYSAKVCSHNWLLSKPPLRTDVIIMLPFVLITFIVYTILPEMRNIHGQTMRGHLGSDIVAYTVLLLAQTNTPLPDVPCMLAAYTIRFSFFATFFWLNAMCFDIWWTFGRSKMLSTIDKQSERKRSFIYSIYGWGCPIIFTIVAITIDSLLGLPEDMVNPQISGWKVCWFVNTDLVRGSYFYGPFGVTLICNNFFFVSTALKLRRDAKDLAQHLEGVDSERHNSNKQWFYLCLKLSILMGISCTLEVLYWVLERPQYLHLVMYLCRALRGPIIFVMLICKKNVIRMLIRYFGLRVPDFLSSDSTKSSTRSSHQASTITVSSSA